MRVSVLVPVCAGCLVGLAGAPADAQTRDGCRASVLSGPPREVIECPGGVSLTVEQGAAYRLVDRNRDGRPDVLDLEDKAALIEVAPHRSGFQVRTPHAVASVRGTVWAVDAQGAVTAVLVEQGVVAVSRRGQRRAALLRAGDGVDVAAGGERGPPLVKRWSAERRLRLLARFGR
ncbi:FecR domain-containing protein [Methylobacterium oryzihabitans]|uniref:Iron dicitrate transport regulator FecR n=1 Tax=Methylobacterium oryzihabitans TaxID=2499852 RepID=A0A437NV28_9HYPH|nr:FecR family protein [Methylobacterium oryzihabitans]RVU13870.1 iron dicitrate transport regulator FecR [Methylobacterium oryzihabitans]